MHLLCKIFQQAVHICRNNASINANFGHQNKSNTWSQPTRWAIQKLTIMCNMYYGQQMLLACWFWYSYGSQPTLHVITKCQYSCHLISQFPLNHANWNKGHTTTKGSGVYLARTELLGVQCETNTITTALNVLHTNMIIKWSQAFRQYKTLHFPTVRTQ